jgi:hypothetical protein
VLVLVSESEKQLEVVSEKRLEVVSEKRLEAVSEFSFAVLVLDSL